MVPTTSPIEAPTPVPIFHPSADPANNSTMPPTSSPTGDHIGTPTLHPTEDPIDNSTVASPTPYPTEDHADTPTLHPAAGPANNFTISPTPLQTDDHTGAPTLNPEEEEHGDNSTTVFQTSPMESVVGTVDSLAATHGSRTKDMKKQHRIKRASKAGGGRASIEE